VIDSAPALHNLVQRIAPLSRIAIDTEADSLHCYFEKLCLIQISIPGWDALVDPLAEVPLAPLCEALAEKDLIIHGADYDLRLLRRVGLAKVTSVFDTMIAARLVGLTEFSLAALLAKYFNVTLAKGSQKANWARRPLSPQMEDYARNDTRYLVALAEILEAQLRSLDRWEWFRQSCERAIASASIDRERDVENLWRITGSSDLQGRSAALLRALWWWRDAEARAVDKPPFHILQNEQLLESARRFDLGEPIALPHLKGIRRRRFFDAAQSALELPESEWPVPIRKPRIRQTPDEQRMFQQLKAARDRAAADLGLDPSLIAPKATIEVLAANPAAAASRLLPWQRELVGLAEHA
jgi:ribonuclease D